MTTPIPLAVRMVTTRADRHVTRQLRDLVIRETAVGGWASVKLALDRPLALQPDEFDYYSRVYVYDRRTGRVVSEGMLEDPGRGASIDGEVWDITAMGPAARAKDQKIPLIYVDRTLDRWVNSAATSKYIRIDRAGDSTPVINIKVDQGAAWAAAGAGIVSYRAVADCGQQLGRVSAAWDTGFTSSNVEIRLSTSIANGTSSTLDTDTASVAGGTLAASRGGSPAIPASHDWALLRMIRPSTTDTGAEDRWCELFNIVVRAILKSATGSDITSGYSADSVLASEVVTDLLGRMLPLYDGAGASIAATSYAIEQLAYPDGVAAADVFDDLMTFEPAYRWGAYESNAAGLYRFEWTTWPTTVRYEADARDGYFAPGSADGLYDTATVRYLDPAGQPKTVRRTSPVAALTAAGLSRSEVIDLGASAGTVANATRAGDQFLSEHAAAPNAGTLTIAKPITDLYSGRRVWPWEIKAGELVRVRGVMPRVDSLNATARDGATVFRVWAKEYSTASATATLELDSYSQTTARALADLAKAKRRT